MSDLPVSALAFVMAREGVNLAKGDIGYVNDPLDPGGATAFGITQHTYDRWRSDHGLASSPVRDIKYPAEVQSIYNRLYWREADCDRFNDSRPRLALVHFDWAFNGGTSRAHRYLQAVVGATVDGIIGPKTLAAVLACDESQAVSEYLILRAAHHHLRAADSHAADSQMLLAEKGLLSVAPTPNPTQIKFLPGWLARLRWCARETSVPIDPSYAQEHT